jgi:tRNA pseudouridine32 synthase / 23S rRNA pseudouridine746 synthase
VTSSQPIAAEPLLENSDIEIVAVDDAFVVINKPSGLLSVPGRGADKQDCVAARVQALFADALTVHRLDMETSGLILMARGIDAQRDLAIAFEKRVIEKKYIAVVSQIILDDEGEINLPLICDWPNRPRQIVEHTIGKPSLTRWRVLARDAQANTTRVELSPVTGRSHQLRVHMNEVGHPILGDSLYGTDASRSASPRLLLHASWLRFPHPTTGEPVEFSLPPEF